MKAVVYDPPGPGFPYLAVIFRADGEVLIARSVQSHAQGESLIAKVVAEFEAAKAAGTIR
jgi:hypothetical protein